VIDSFFYKYYLQVESTEKNIDHKKNDLLFDCIVWEDPIKKQQPTDDEAEKQQSTVDKGEVKDMKVVTRWRCSDQSDPTPIYLDDLKTDSEFIVWKGNAILHVQYP